MNIREKFRKRWLGERGYWAGVPELAQIPIVTSTKERLENNQTQQKALRDKPYKLGARPPKHKIGMIRYGK